MTKLNKNKNTAAEGFGLGIAFVLISLYLFFDTTTFNSETLKYILSTGSGLIGALGLGVEMHKVTGEKFSIDNISVGFVCVAIYIFLANYFENDLAQSLILSILLLGLYGIVSGFINLIVNLINNKNSKRTNFRNIVLFVFEIIGAIAALLSIFQIIS